MIKRSTIGFSILITLNLHFFLWSFCYSQQFQLSTYNIDEGLSRGLIKDIHTDQIGFLWSATDEGVIKYDGQKAIFYKELFPGGFAKDLYERKDGTLLVLHDFGVTEINSRPDTTYFKNIIKANTEDTDTTLFYAKSIFEDREGTLWFGENQSVSRFSSEGFKKFRFDDKDYADSFIRGFAFAEDGYGTLWAMSFNGNLYYYETEDEVFIPVETNQAFEQVSSISQIAENELWVGAKNGVFALQMSSDKKVISIQKIPGIENVSCSQLVNGNILYAGTWDKGLYKANINSDSIVFEPVSILSFKDIVNIYFDDLNGLWVCSSENVGLLHPIFFKTFDLGLKPPSTSIEGLSLTPDGAIIVSSGENIFELKKNNNSWRKSFSLFNEDLYVMATQADSNLFWIGDFSGAIYRYQLDKKVFNRIEGPEPGPSNRITDIFKDSGENLWVMGNNQNGLIRIDPLHQLHYYKGNGLGNIKVMAEAPNGTIYCAGGNARNYLFAYIKEKDSFIDIGVPLPFDPGAHFTVEDMLIDRNGDLLLGTSDGLLRLKFLSHVKEGVQVERINLIKVPEDEPVKALAQDEKGVLWVATPSGLIHYQNRSALLFDKVSGLPGKNLSYRGLILDRDDNLWVATAQGLAYFQAGNTNTPYTPTPVFTSLKANGEKVHINQDPFTFPHNSFFSIDFVSLSFPTDRIMYQTRVPEIDAEWSRPTSVNHVIYPKLAPGTYSFQVRAQQHGGLLWSEPNSFTFNVDYPWYTSWWAISLFLLAFSGIVILAVKMYNWNLVKKNERLEKIISDRTREINAQKNAMIEQKNQIIDQKEKLILQNELVFKTRQALAEAELKNRELHEKQLEQELENRNKQLTTITLKIIKKNETLKELKSKIQQLAASNGNKPAPQLSGLVKTIDLSFRLEKDWNEFTMCFERVYVGFYSNLKKQYPDLTTHDLRHCALIRLNMTIKEAADVLGISSESVKIFRFRLRKKLGLSSQKDLAKLIMNS